MSTYATELLGSSKQAVVEECLRQKDLAEHFQKLLAEETAAREAAEEAVCKLGGGPRTMKDEEVAVLKEAGGDVLQLAKMVLKHRKQLDGVRDAVEYANHRWDEWGERALTVIEMIDAALEGK